MTLTKTKYLTLAALVSLGLSPIAFAAPSSNSKAKQQADEQEELVDVEEEDEEGEDEVGDDSLVVSDEHPSDGYIDEEIVVSY